MKNFLTKALSSDSPVSSKRLSGFIGWIVYILSVMAYVIFSIVKSLPPPTDILTTLVIASTALLGLETLTNMFKK